MPTIKIFNNLNPKLDKEIDYEFGDEKLEEILKIYDQSITKNHYHIAIGNELFDDWTLPIDTCLAYGDSILIAEEVKIPIPIPIPSDEEELDGCMPFANVTADGRSHEWSSDAPKWRIASKGLCLEGKCKNRQCKAFDKMVVINMGVPISYKIGMPGQKKTNCPICNTHVNIETCAFNECSFRYIGVMNTDNGPVRHKSEWKQISGSYYRFDETNKSNWNR